MTLTEAYLGINKEIRKKEAEEKKGVNHILHFFLTVLTAGFWVIVWVIVAIHNSSKKKKLAEELAELYELRDEAKLKIEMGKK